MRTGGESPTAEHAALALYLLGALDDAERVAFERHLAGCGECLSAAGELGSVTSALGGLDAAEWEALAAAPPDFVADLPPEFTAHLPPERDQPSPSAQQQAPAEPARIQAGVDETPPDPTGPDDTGPTAPRGRAGAGSRAAGSTRPAGSRPGRTSGAGSRGAPGPDRPPSSARRRRFVLWGGIATALVAVVLAGGLVRNLGDQDRLVLTATGEAAAQGVSLSVTITTDEEKQAATMRITATGLRQGLRYRVFGVTRDGTTHVIRDWTASAGPQEVTGELKLPIDDLAFVTVGLVDGTAIITAPISR